MKKKLSILIAVVMAISLCLIPSAVLAVDTPDAPVIDGVASFTEWQEATVIQVADSMGTVKVIAYPDYLYLLFIVTDSTDARLGQPVGNDKFGVNINPTPGASWGMPCDIIFQTGTDPNAWQAPSMGPTDGWETDWQIKGVQQTLPADVLTKTLYSGTTRISEWKIPLATIAPSPGSTIKLGGACDIDVANAGLSFSYPPALAWGDVATYAVIPVQNATSVGATTEVLDDVISINVDPSFLDFGSVYRGQSSDLVPITITNTGTVSVDVTASTTSVFYGANLTLSGDPVGTWGVTMAYGASSHTVQTQVNVPSDWDAGIEAGTIIFWAEATP